MAYQGNYPPSTPLTSSQIAAGAVQPSNLSSIGPSWDGSGNLSVLGSSGSSSNRLSFTYNGSSGEATIGPNSTGGTTFLTFGTSSSGTYSERMRIDSSGNVGIGTSSPASYGQFVVYNAATGVTRTYGGTVGAYMFASSGGGVAAVGTETNHPFAFYTNGTERVRITNNGEFWWNCYPTRPHLATGTNVTGFQLSTQYGVEVNNRDALVGIFNRTNSTGAIVEWKYNASVIGSVSTNGSSTSYNTSSDYRLKTNIEPLVGALDRVAALFVHRFNWLIDPDAPKVDGFLAHEAQAVVSECVTGEKDSVDNEGKPVYQGIDHSKLVPLLTAAIQELSAKNDALEARLAALEAK